MIRRLLGHTRDGERCRGQGHSTNVAQESQPQGGVEGETGWAVPCLVRGEQVQEGERAPLWAGCLSLHRKCPCERPENMVVVTRFLFIYF